MQPKVTNTLLFYSRFATTALLLAVNPNFAWAKAPCISKSNAGNSCVLEQSQGLKSQNISQDSDALAIDHLYYSGGILHNKVLAGETTPIKGLQQPVDTAEKLARKQKLQKTLIKGPVQLVFTVEATEYFKISMKRAENQSKNVLDLGLMMQNLTVFGENRPAMQLVILKAPLADQEKRTNRAYF